MRGVATLVLILVAVFSSWKLGAASVETRLLPSFAENATQTASCAYSCGKSSDKASNVQVSVSPCNPKGGDTVTVSLSYTLNEVVTGGQQTVTLSYNGNKFPASNADLCLGGKFANTTAPCPTPAAPYNGKATTSAKLGAILPPGTYIGRQTWNDQNGDQILCILYELSV